MKIFLLNFSLNNMFSVNNVQYAFQQVREYSTKIGSGSSSIHGISQNPDTKDYLLILQNEDCIEYMESCCKYCSNKYTDVKHKWCQQCKKSDITNWTSGNEKIDKLIQEMKLKITDQTNITFEWIPYDQFNNIKAIGKGGFATIYSAIWKDGLLKYDSDKNEYKRMPNKEVALKCLHDSQNITDEFLNEVWNLYCKCNLLSTQ